MTDTETHSQKASDIHDSRPQQEIGGSTIDDSCVGALEEGELFVRAVDAVSLAGSEVKGAFATWC